MTNVGIVGGLAGTPLPQRAAEADKAAHEGADHARAAQSAQRAEQAAGIGQTEEDAEASDRDADGRRPWEQAAPAAAQSTEDPAAATQQPRSKDPTGTCGLELDVIG